MCLTAPDDPELCIHGHQAHHLEHMTVYSWWANIGGQLYRQQNNASVVPTGLLYIAYYNAKVAVLKPFNIEYHHSINETFSVMSNSKVDDSDVKYESRVNVYII